MVRTVIFPYGEYTMDEYSESEVASNLTLDDMKVMYANGTVVTVVYNDVTYECTPIYFTDDMDDGFYGFGNAARFGVQGEEPFLLFRGEWSDSSWWCEDHTGSVSITLSAYIDDAASSDEYVIMKKRDYKAICDFVRSKTLKADLIKSGDMVTEMENALKIPKTVAIDYSGFDNGTFVETLDTGDTLTYTVEFTDDRPSKVTSPDGTKTVIDWGEDL